MAKKQLRISQSEEIRRRAPDFILSPVDLVLTDQTAVHGILRTVLDDRIILTNMRLKKIEIPIHRISEFFTDLKA